MKEIYAALNPQIEQKNMECDVGDFNAKLEIAGEDRKQTESRNGKNHHELIKQNNLHPVNITIEKSVIDHILVSPRIRKGITTMIIDEDGRIGIKGKMKLTITLKTRKAGKNQQHDNKKQQQKSDNSWDI